MRLRAPAPAKVNLCLFLGPTRDEDGRHELVTVFQSLSLWDEVEMAVRLEPDARDEVACPGVEGENLAEAALRGLRAAGWQVLLCCRQAKSSVACCLPSQS